ncbi:MAG: tyrosine-type recombinase/integrase [Akkermansiaceae bacterium]|nr:tyrosine-type recombinase/integrase [Akkermansiaceae bacterium]
MASLKKRKNSAVWYAQFYVPDPETGGLLQVRKSTGHTNQKKAKEAAADIERAAQGAIKAGSDKARQARDILAEAVQELERETFTGLTARKHLARLLAIATGEEMTAYTLETWAAEWLRRKAINSSKATMARYRGHTEAFLSWLGTDRRRKPLESVTGQDVRLWQESLKDGGRTGKTVLSYVKDIGAIYRAAIREGLVAVNPCGAVIGDIDTDDSQDRKPFTPTEVSALVAAAPSEEWRGLIITATFTALRLGDAARLSWASVDLQEKLITLIPSKTKKKKREVRIPIHTDLLAYLEKVPVPDDSPTAPVFPKLSKARIGSRGGLSETFAGIMAAAGVDRGKPSRVLEEGQERGAGRITYERGFHSLRHSLTSWLRDAGVSEEDRMDITGHSTRESHQIYSHASEQAGRDAIAKVPSLPKS